MSDKFSDKEIAVIQACAYYCNGDENFTNEAQVVLSRLLKRLNMDNRVLSMKVWQ